MSVARSLPYLQADPSRIRMEKWMTVANGKSDTLGVALADWDPATAVTFRRRVAVDLDGVREDCGLPRGCRLTLGAFWRCGGTTLRGQGTRVVSGGGCSLEEQVQITIPGESLSGDVKVYIGVALAERIPRAPLRAYRSGTILWESVQQLQLEGGGARFPMEARSFGVASWKFPNKAAWLLDLDTDDWEMPVLGGMRLYLNEDHPLVAQYLADPRSPAGLFVEQTLFFDVGRQLVRAALASDEFLKHESTWPRQTLGDAVARLLRSRFANTPPGGLAGEMQSNSAGFDARLQDALEAWWESA